MIVPCSSYGSSTSWLDRRSWERDLRARLKEGHSRALNKAAGTASGQWLGEDGRLMKVLDQSGRGVEVGSRLDLSALGLPLSGAHAALIVFWKRL